MERAFCFEDADCADGQTCVADLTSNTSYCASTCVRDADCPIDQTCRLGTPARAAEPSIMLCVDRVRTCTDVELCNGLDDDCDGVVDNEGCQPIAACLDDRPCGGFVCSAPLNQTLALCAPPNDAVRDDFEVCEDDAQCRNGICQTGRCAPTCRPESSGTRVCPTGKVCARSVGGTPRPEINQCQSPCLDSGDCTTDGERCSWRSVYQDAEDHHSVCARPDPGRKPDGAACSNNTPAGDDECQSGLCFGRVCTRFCEGSGTDCSDISADARCCNTQLRYGLAEFARFTCVVGGTCR